MLSTHWRASETAARRRGAVDKRSPPRLGGIAIAVGAMVDAAMVRIEIAHKHLEQAPPGKPRVEALIEAAIEVGPTLFFFLLVITVRADLDLSPRICALSRDHCSTQGRGRRSKADIVATVPRR